MKTSTSLSSDVVVPKDIQLTLADIRKAQVARGEKSLPDVVRPSLTSMYADINTLLSITDSLLTSSYAEGADCQIAKVIPVGHSYSVAIGSLGIKLFNSLTDAREVRDAINKAIAAAFSQRSGAMKAGSDQGGVAGSVQHDPERFAFSGQCDNGAHTHCPYPDRCKCSCHQSISTPAERAGSR